METLFLSANDPKCAETAAEIIKTGLSVRELRPIGSARHIFTHVEWDMMGFAAVVEGKTADLVFERPETIIRDYAVPTAFRYFLDVMKTAD